MRHAHLPPIAALLLALAVPAGPAAAAEPGGAFLMFMGSDTLAIERFERAGGGMTAMLVFRLAGSRVTWRTSEAPDGTLQRMEAEFGLATDPPGTPPKQTATLEFAGDSVRVETRPGGPQRLATKPGARPFVNPSVALVAEFATRTMPPPFGRAEGALFLLAGGGTVDAVVTRPAADSVVVAFGGVSFCFGLDRDGDVVRGRVPEQGLSIVRVATLPPELLSLPAPDYSAPPGAPYTAHEVSVPARGGFALAGTLTLPADARGRVPCAVTITGSGQQDRDESIAIVRGYRPFREVADALARRGIAVLRLDDRGVGGSGGPVRGATTADFARDVEDALRWLRARPDIDGRRLALVGHSEGGLIAPLVAARDPQLRAVALLAAPAWPGRRVLEYQHGRVLERQVGAAGRDSALGAAMAEVDSVAARDAWLAFFLAHDPLAAIRQVRVPVLILQGETDRQVTAEQAPALAEALARAGNRDVTTRVFPGVNHLFLADPDGDPAGYLRLAEREMGPRVLAPLADWLEQRLR